MTFTYSGDPSTSIKDAIRFHTQDTKSTEPLITDEEISFIISTWSHVTDNPLYLAAAACVTISAKYASEISYSADGVSVSSSELQDKYDRLAVKLRDQYKANVIGGGPDVGGIMIGEQRDYSIKPLTFAKGMHDNVEAGQQDFGGQQLNLFDPLEGGY